MLELGLRAALLHLLRTTAADLILAFRHVLASIVADLYSCITTGALPLPPGAEGTPSSL